jgi:hypothetical protein
MAPNTLTNDNHRNDILLMLPALSYQQLDIAQSTTGSPTFVDDRQFTNRLKKGRVVCFSGSRSASQAVWSFISSHYIRQDYYFSHIRP